MATGMNLELTQMARATDFSYEQLRQVADNFISPLSRAPDRC